MIHFISKKQFEPIYAFLISRTALVFAFIILLDFSLSFFTPQEYTILDYDTNTGYGGDVYHYEAIDNVIFTDQGDVFVEGEIYVETKVGDQLTIYNSPIFNQVLKIKIHKGNIYWFQASIYGSFFFIPVIYLLLLVIYFLNLSKLYKCSKDILAGLIFVGIGLVAFILLS